MSGHYNSPDRFGPPWIDLGKHKTRTAGLRRLWLHEPGDKPGDLKYWICAVAGEGSTSGDTKDQAIANAKNW